MKRLFLTFGLVIAFFVSPVQASIYDSVTKVEPKVESKPQFNCITNSPYKGGIVTRAADCPSLLQPLLDGRHQQGTSTSYECRIIGATPERNGASVAVICTFAFPCEDGKSCRSNDITGGKLVRMPSVNAKDCPPLGNTTHTLGYGVEPNQADYKCYNPEELDNSSNCANDVGSMIPALTNINQKVCKTNPDTGASCGYSRGTNQNSFSLDLEMNCFGGGDDDKVPEYDDEPMPEPDTCSKMNDQLMVCKDDPLEKCDAQGVCEDDCGYVNGTFYCFEQCSGAECDEETPPTVNCENTPDDPSCVTKPTPEHCEANPTDPACNVNPPVPCEGDDCETGGGGGGGGTEIDIGPIVDELKEINRELDFKTDKKAFTLDDLGGFGSIFGPDDLDKVGLQITDKKDEISDYMSTLKGEYQNLFELKGVSGGSYDMPSINLSMGTFEIGAWDFIVRNIGMISAVIMFLAYLMAMRVLLS